MFGTLTTLDLSLLPTATAIFDTQHCAPKWRSAPLFVPGGESGDLADYPMSSAAKSQIAQLWRHSSNDRNVAAAIAKEICHD